MNEFNKCIYNVISNIFQFSIVRKLLFLFEIIYEKFIKKRKIHDLKTVPNI